MDEEQPFDPTGKHILVVDDEADIREYLRGLLESVGYRVSEASGGRAAWKIVEIDSSIELVITDILMPEGDGM